jgi:aspartyl protease family protein
MSTSCGRVNSSLAIAVPVDTPQAGPTATPFIGERPGEFEQRRQKAVRGEWPASAPVKFSALGSEFPPNAHGQFHLDTVVDGAAITMLLDTGASLVALSSEDAIRAGVHLHPGDFRSSLATANGVVKAAPVRIRELKVGGITAHDVEAVVLPPGSLAQSLLGMSFLRRVDRVEIVYGRLRLSGF